MFLDVGRANRRASLKGIPTRPGFDHDEYDAQGLQIRA
jgi:hypothetical protein